MGLLVGPTVRKEKEDIMKKNAFLVVITVLLAFNLIVMLERPVQAAAQNTPFNFEVATDTHDTCTIKANVTKYCFAADGAWISPSGGAWVNFSTPSSGGATSFSQLTGTASLSQLPTIPTTKISGQITAAQLPPLAVCKEVPNVSAAQNTDVGPCH